MQITISKATTGQTITTRDAYDAYHFARELVAGDPESVVPVEAERPLVFLLQYLEEVGGYNQGTHIQWSAAAAEEHGEQLGLTVTFTE